MNAITETDRIIYKFVPCKFGKDALNDRRLKISHITGLNDPFEYLNVITKTVAERNAMREFKDKLAATQGLISFSKSWNNPLLWTHYAEDHTGMALGFAVPNSVVRKMNYIRRKESINLEKAKDPKTKQKYLDLFYSSKHINWKYEGEYRLPVSYTNDSHLITKINSKLWFRDFNKNLELREVVLGHNYVSQNCSSLEETLMKQGVKFTTARPAFNDFKMVTQRNNKFLKKL